ncbi:hypothetical protein NIES4074_22310 [Cylindrospermum sp. NIES-4074]|nr:hypothetical protein NIES4074_22310 [Cylindrospermum sp. NIES-4074]
MYKPLQHPKSSRIPTTAPKTSNSQNGQGAVVVQPKGLETTAKESDVTEYSQQAADFLQMKMLGRAEASGEKQTQSQANVPSFVQRAPLPLVAEGLGGIAVQAKLTIGAPGDKYEQEADQMAQQVVMRMQTPAPPLSANGNALQHQQMGDETGKLRMKPKAEKLITPMVQRQSDQAIAAPSNLESSIERLRGSGQPLDTSIRQPMEQAFGANFSGVKVHTDTQSDQMNQSIQAQAFTTGQDVFFRQGAYDPGSSGGQELIAHELTHVVQQKQEVIQTKTDQSIKPLPANIIGHQLIGKSTTEQMNELVEKYNKIEADNKDYQAQLDILLQISTLIGKWNANYSGGANQKVNKMEQIENLSVQVSTEIAEVQKQQKGSGQDSNQSSLDKVSNSSNPQVADNQPVVEADNPVEEKKSKLAKGKTIKRGQGIIAAICKDEGITGGHSWVAFEYITQGGEAKNGVMHLTAKGGKGDSASGGSGGSGSSDHRQVKHIGSVDSGTVSNEKDSGSIVYSGSTNSNSGSAEPETFGGSITINIDDKAADSYLENLAGKISRTWDITDKQAANALNKGQTMKAENDQGKYIYAITGRSLSPTKTGMNCARFAEEIVNAAGIDASAGLIIKTPSEIATGKKGGLSHPSKNSSGSSSGSSSSS